MFAHFLIKFQVVITPTRVLLVVPELLMGNRVLRTFDKDGNGALRIQFRDDDGTPLRLNTVGLFLIQTTTFNTLSRGIYIGGILFIQCFFLTKEKVEQKVERLAYD